MRSAFEKEAMRQCSSCSPIKQVGTTVSDRFRQRSPTIHGNLVGPTAVDQKIFIAEDRQRACEKATRASTTLHRQVITSSNCAAYEDGDDHRQAETHRAGCSRKFSAPGLPAHRRPVNIWLMIEKKLICEATELFQFARVSVKAARLTWKNAQN